ncbi:uncharacterized protein [Lolium perenne]|uniref:uncharacterized protein n=1 Tax=Lolium perenne TaxID=4522 RepID=UPI0021EAF839|nr:uncharacterized protein LOC127292621 [Lolium perenne]
MRTLYVRPARTLCGRSRLAAQRYLFVPTKAEAAGSRQLWSIMSSREEDVRVNGDHQLVADGGVNGEGEGELEAVMEQQAPEGVRALHARVEAEWGPVLQSACQTAAARALWASAVRDPAAGVLAGEKHLRGLHEKMRRDERAGAREVPGVMIAVRTLWFDARIEAAVSNLGGAPQVVLLGAGMDARAYRLSCLKECTVFELDFSELLEMKSDILHEAISSSNHQKLTMMAKSLIRVPADIRDVGWMTKLQSCGYVPERNTIWVLEGILYYLHHVHAMQVLETIAACRASACTVLLADFMNKNATALSQTMYHFYHDNPDLLLPSIGFSQAMLSQIGDPQAHFGLLNHPQNMFDKLRRLPRSMETNPEDGTPCRRLYLVEASASPDDHTIL